MKRTSKLLRCLAIPSYLRALALYQVAAAVEHEPVLRMLRCRTVVDVGANAGQFALAARHCLPEARIICFEPLIAAADKLRSTMGKDRNVAIHCVALGPRAGRFPMHLSARLDSSSLLPIGANQSAIFTGTHQVGISDVEVRRLEDCLAAGEITSPAVLKLDVQGFELEVLKSSESLLSLFAHVYAECSFVELYSGQALADEVISWLGQRGHSLTGIYNPVYQGGRTVQADLLFSSSVATHVG